MAISPTLDPTRSPKQRYPRPAETSDSMSFLRPGNPGEVGLVVNRALRVRATGWSWRRDRRTEPAAGIRKASQQ